MKIEIYHPKLNNTKSYTTRKAEKGTRVIAVQNIAGEFKPGTILVIGLPNQELTEFAVIESILGKEITLTAQLNQTHAINTRIGTSDWNEVVIYKSNSINGQYIQQATKPIAIDEELTVYYDETTTNENFYKTRFHNTVNDKYSDYSDPISFAGFPKDSLIAIQDRVLRLFGDKDEKVITRNDITDWINQAKDDLVNAVAESDEKYFNETITGDISQGDHTIILPDKFKKFQKVKIKYGGKFEEAIPVDLEDLIDYDEFNSQNSPIYAFNNYKIEIRPKAQSITPYRIKAETNQDDLINEKDRLPKVLRPYSHVIDLFVLSKAYSSDQKHNVARGYMRDYETKKDEMIEQINDINLSYNRGIK